MQTTTLKTTFVQDFESVLNNCCRSRNSISVLNKFCLDTSSESFYFPLAPSLKWCTGGDSRGSRLYMAGLRNIADSLDHSTTTARLSVFFSKYISVNYLTTHFVSIGTTEVFIFKISFLGDFDNLCPKLWPNVFFISFYF